MRRKARHAAGFTLVEALIASAVLSFVVAAITQAIAAGHGQTHAALHAGRAVELGGAMLEEVLSKPWHDPDGESAPGPDDGEASRDDFDNLDDYHDYTEDPGELTDHIGAAYGEHHQRFARAVRVSQHTVSGALGDRRGVLITVTVSDETGRKWIVTRFVAESAATAGGSP